MGRIEPGGWPKSFIKKRIKEKKMWAKLHKDMAKALEKQVVALERGESYET